MRRHQIIVGILGLAVLAFGSTPGSAGNLRSSRGRMLPQAVHGTAYAALQPVGAASGWGRVTVRDDDLPSGLHRTVQVWLFGLDSRTAYAIQIDGVEIGTVFTRPSGSGVLKLQNRGNGHGSVPQDLPPVDLLNAVVVLGPNSDPTLEGTFSSLTHPDAETTCEEQIALEDVTGGDATGAAKYEEKEDGHQEFVTHAAGLVSGEVYSVRVDGLVVASVTADAQGQARVSLEDPDDDDPLPPELSPVSEIEVVEWLDPGAETLLYGVFSGVCSCQNLTGTVIAVLNDSFTIETDVDSVEVAITESTEWEDFGDHELAIGDAVKVEGCWDDDIFVAEKVELKGDGWQEDCVKLVGVIGDVSGENFVLDTDDGSITVVTTGDTDWDDFGERLPEIGDRVKVEGCWDDDVLIAHEVELLEDDDGDDNEGACDEYVGKVSDVDDGGFRLEHGNRPIDVTTTADTDWEDFNGHVLEVGDKVKVDGCWEGDVFIASRVELKKPA